MTNSPSSARQSAMIVEWHMAAPLRDRTDLGDLHRTSQVTAQSSQPPKSRIRESIAISALGAYGVLLLLATMWPTPLDRGFESSITRLLDVLHRNGVPEWFGYHKLEFTANIAMFVPL